MKLYSYIISFLLSISLTAVASIEFNYQDESLKDVSRYNQIANQIHHKFESYIGERLYKPLSSKILPEIYFANQVYELEKKKIFFRVGIKTPKEQLDKVLKFKNGYIYNSNQDFGFAFMAQNLSKKEFLEHLKEFKKIASKANSSKEYSLLNKLNLFNQAYANENVGCNTFSRNNVIVDVDDFDQVNNHVASESMMSVVSDCFMDAVKQAWNSTGGMVQDLGSGIWNFIKSPIKSAQKAWDGAVNMVEATGNFLGAIKENLSAVGSIFASLSGAMVRQILCMVTGSLGGEQLLKMLVNPAVGIALLIPKIATFFNKIKSVSGILKTIDQASKGIAGSASLVKNAVRNLLKDGSEVLVKKVKELSDFGLSKLTLRYASCGI